MRKALISFAALVALVAAACDPAAYEALPDDTQRDIVIGKTVKAWSNKSDSERLTRLARELNALSPAEKAQATGWAQQTWAFLDAAQAAQRRARAARSSDCYGALHHFSGDHATARRVIHRESRNNPRAANPSSSARGCFQLLAMHDWRYYEVGCTPSQKLQAVCNVKAADHLYRAAGWSPWRATV